MGGPTVQPMLRDGVVQREDARFFSAVSRSANQAFRTVEKTE